MNPSAVAATGASAAEVESAMSRDHVGALRVLADEVVYLREVESLASTRFAYESYPPVSDLDVERALLRARM